MSDVFEGLGEYLGVYSEEGNAPSSMMGYGYGMSGLAAVLDPQIGAPQPSGSGSVAVTRIPTLTLQNYLNSLEAYVTKTGYLDKETAAGWNLYTSVFKEPQPNIAAAKVNGLTDLKNVNITQAALSRLQDRANRSGRLPEMTALPVGQKPKKASGSSTAAKVQVAPKPGTSQKPAGNSLTTSVASVQDILIRLGWRGDNLTSGPISPKLTDGEYGSMTANNWIRSANKRKLVNTITRVDGYTVRVDEKTFLELKAVADQLSPPNGNTAPAPAASTTTITEARLNEVLGRLAGAPMGTVATWERLVSDYQLRAKNGGLDGSISKNQSGQVVVTTKTWDAFIAAFNTLPAPAPKPTPDQQSDVDKASAEISKSSTASLPIVTLRKYLNIAIEKGVLKHEPFKSDVWVPEYATMLVTLSQAAGAWKTAYEQMLVVGKLVGKDGKTVKFAPKLVSEIKKTVSDYEAQQKAQNAVKPNFTKVTTSQVIGWVNGLNVTNKTFNTAGGAKEMADALRTFLDNTKQKGPSEIVWIQDKTKDVFVHNDVLTLLATAVTDEKQKTQASQAYRDKLVSDALQRSTGSVTVDQLQLAFIETVESKKAGKNEKLYSKVKNTGNFDAATKDAYTELARTDILGVSMLEYEKLLKAQLGPNFKPAQVESVRNKVWAEYLKQALSGTTLKTLPTIATNVAAAAKARTDRLGSQAVNQQKKDAAKALVADAISKSTFYISVFDVQMGLNELKGVKVPVTGRTDDATLKALKTYILPGMVFPKDANIEQAEFNTYLNNIGVNISKDKAVFGWKNANWLALTQAAASFLTQRAGTYMGKHGVPKGYAGLAQIPVTDARFKKGTVVKAEVKKPKTEDKVVDFNKKKEQKKLEEEAKKLRDQIAKDKAATKKAKAEAKKKRDEANAAKKKAAEDASNKAAQEEAARKEAEARAAEEEAARKAQQEAQNQQKAADIQQQISSNTSTSSTTNTVTNTTNTVNNTTTTTGGSGSDSGTPIFTPAPPAPLPDITPAPAPAPEPAPTPAPEPVQAGMFSPTAFLLMSAAGLGYLIFGGKEDKKQQTRYSTNRRRT